MRAWQSLEAEFERRWNALGKQAWFHRIEDAADAFGLNKRLVRTTRKPADYFAVYRGWTGFVECKSTDNGTGFRLSNISRHQLASATRIHAAGGDYRFLICCEPTREVYLIPASFILPRKGTLTWTLLEPWRWSGDDPCLLPLTPIGAASILKPQGLPLTTRQ